jgi:hypothetical protein
MLGPADAGSGRAEIMAAMLDGDGHEDDGALLRLVIAGPTAAPTPATPHR